MNIIKRIKSFYEFKNSRFYDFFIFEFLKKKIGMN